MPVGTSIDINLSLKWGPFFQEKLTEETEIQILLKMDAHTYRKDSKYINIY